MTAPPAPPAPPTAPVQFKVTYTSANVDWELFHRLFDEALAAVRAQCGRDHPLHIGGEPVAVAGDPIVDVAPADTTGVLGRFAPAGVEHVDRAVRVAHAAQRGWGRRPGPQRVGTRRRAAALVRERQIQLAGLMSLAR